MQSILNSPLKVNISTALGELYSLCKRIITNQLSLAINRSIEGVYTVVYTLHVIYTCLTLLREIKINIDKNEYSIKEIQNNFLLCIMT